MAELILIKLRKANRITAIAVGIMFFFCACLVLLDILLRRVGSSLGGTDEIAGYVMAIGVSWGMAFALVELAHVRIDFLRSLLRSRIRVGMDLFSMFSLAATVSIIAVQCWPVLATTLKNGSRANTPLETPLALVQIPWMLGWVWFALSAWLTLMASFLLLARGEFDKVENTIGVFPEVEEF